MNPPASPRTDCIERYCPHICKNVPLIRKRDGSSVRFTCLMAEHCAVRRDPDRSCAHGKTVRLDPACEG